MATHTDTSALKPYNAANFPSIEGGESKFITNELKKIENAIVAIIAACKLMEARMNTNGLT